MKKCILFFTMIFMFSTIQIDAQPQIGSRGTVKHKQPVAHPEVPRASAYEAFRKYKAGKAILIQSGGISFASRHIIGAFNAVSAEKVVRGQVKLPDFPRNGVEIFTYCY